jgi:hypothetical protein
MEQGRPPLRDQSGQDKEAKSFYSCSIKDIYKAFYLPNPINMPRSLIMNNIHAIAKEAVFFHLSHFGTAIKSKTPETLYRKPFEYHSLLSQFGTVRRWRGKQLPVEGFRGSIVPFWDKRKYFFEMKRLLFLNSESVLMNRLFFI